MQPLRVTLIFIGTIFLGGALVSPWVYKLAQVAAQEFPALASLGRQPFPRYVNRSLLILTVVGLWPFLRQTGVRSWRDLGLGTADRRWQQARWGLLVGFGSLALAAGLTMLAGARSFNVEHGTFQLLRHVGSVATTALGVACIEEIIFRGALLSALQKSVSPVASLLTSSLIYAAAHFLKRAGEVESVQWDSGFVVLLDMARGFGRVEMFVPEFVNLTIAGLLLGRVFQRTGALYASIGLHAGWIFWLKTFGYITIERSAGAPWFWGSARLMDGWLALVVLLGSCVSIRWLQQKKETR